MSSNVATVYSADKVDLLIANVIINTGWINGEFLSLEAAEKDYEAEVGADGETAISQTNNKNGTAKIKLLHTASGNTTLANMRLTGIASAQGILAGSFECRDRSSGAILASASLCYIEGQPKQGRARRVGEVEWSIYLINATWKAYGNAPLTSTGG